MTKDNLKFMALKNQLTEQTQLVGLKISAYYHLRVGEFDDAEEFDIYTFPGGLFAIYCYGGGYYTTTGLMSNEDVLQLPEYAVKFIEKVTKWRGAIT